MPESGTKIVFAFGGQGAQYPAMGADLFRHDRQFRNSLEYIAEIVTRESPVRVLDELYRKTSADDDVRLTHPAIFSVQYALASSLMHDGLRPDYVLGMSTGEFAAAAISGAIKLADAVYLVLQQAKALNDNLIPGGMLAILRPPELYQEFPLLSQKCELALAGTAHFVVTGSASTLDTVAAQLAARAIPHRRLPVRVGFHSPLIDLARDQYLAAAPGLAMSHPAIPLVSCSTGGTFYGPLTPAHFWQAIRVPMRVIEAARAVGSTGRHVYVDIGPGGAISALLKQSRVRMASCHTLLSPLGDEMRARAAVAAVAAVPAVLETGR
jgi:acyl transferase domain-containing protein